jgi:site-specific DNA-cytosine methylase
MVVLSLFDGMSCGRIALERANIEVDKYFASEIDKYAITVSTNNYPDIIQIGDVTKVSYLDGILYTEKGEYRVGKIDLLIGALRAKLYLV